MIIGGKEKTIKLGKHKVRVIQPKKQCSYEEGTKRIERIVERIEKDRVMKEEYKNDMEIAKKLLEIVKSFIDKWDRRISNL
jgi:hypothetical protein